MEWPAVPGPFSVPASTASVARTMLSVYYSCTLPAVLQVTQYFPREGSEMTPVHASEEFLWKDYAPMAFRCALFESRVTRL